MPSSAKLKEVPASKRKVALPGTQSALLGMLPWPWITKTTEGPLLRQKYLMILTRPGR